MINPKVTEKLMDYIEKIYPGGILGFQQEGGDLTYLPESIILSLPEKNNKLRVEIKNAFKDIPFFFFSDPFEMEPQVFAEIRNDLIKLLMGDEVGTYAQAVSISLRSCYVLVQSMSNLPQPLIKSIRQMLEDFGVQRSIFVQPDKMPELWEVVEEKEEKPVNKGETVISSDQITDLRINLNKEQDVMDFLKSLEG